MKEKGRYEIHMYDDCCVDLYDNGVLDKSITDQWELEKLLNQQDARIKELEKENQKANIKNYLTDYYLVEKENQQLREDWQAKDILVNTYMSVVGTLDNAKQLKQSQKQLAIEELEKMREKFGYRYNSQLVVSSKYLSDFIDNQIKELKKEKNNGIQ